MRRYGIKKGNVRPRKANRAKTRQGIARPMQSKARGCFWGGALKVCLGVAK